MVVRAFTAANEGEPFLHLLRYVDEEGVLFFLRHFGLATDAKPKHITSRFFLHGGFRPLHRLLPLVVDHVNLWRKGVSVDLHFFCFGSAKVS